MASKEHQRMLNSLALALEKEGVKITHLDIDGMLEYFEEKYRNLPTPTERDGHIPDLEGMQNGLKHLGEVKTDVYGDNNIDSQLNVFANRQMNGQSIPLHITVPKALVDDLRKKLSELGLQESLIRIWSYP